LHGGDAHESEGVGAPLTRVWNAESDSLRAVAASESPLLK